MNYDSIITNEELQWILAREIATSTIERKYSLQSWRSGEASLVLFSEHGWELSAYIVKNEELKNRLMGFWQHNRWGDCIGRKTAKQIAKKLGYDLQEQIDAYTARMEREERNNNRSRINYFANNAKEIEKEFNQWLENSYKGTLAGMPKGTWVSIKVQLFDEVGNVVEPDMDIEK